MTIALWSLILRRRSAWLLALNLAVSVAAAQAGSTQSPVETDSESDVAALLRMPGTLQARVRFDHITSADGLSNDSVFSILQDRYGFLWFGTQAGLNRYDGYRVTQYRHDPKNPKSLPNDFIQVLTEDRNGGIWTANGRFDPETETFTPLVIPQRDSGLKPLTVQAISDDRSGHVWIGMSGGHSVYRFDSQTSRLTGFDIGSSLPARPDNPVLSIYCDPAGILWLGAADGLIRFDPTTGASTHYADRRLNQEPTNIRAIARDRNGSLWLAAAGDERNFFDPVRHALGFGWPAVKRPRPDAPTTAILADRGGVLWLGTPDRLELFDPSRHGVAFLRHNAADRYSISSNEILSLATDRDGDVWVGTKGGGVNRFSPDTLRFGAWRPDPSDPQGLSDENVRAIYQDRAGTVWIGTYDGGLNRFDTRSGTFTHFRHRDGTPGSLDDDRVYSIYEDRAGDLWVGTARGINRLNRKTGVFTHFHRGPIDAAGAAVPTYSLLEDHRGVFWFGAAEDRATLDRRTGAVTPVSEIGGLSMYEDRKDNLWFASNHGLTKMDVTGATHRISVPQTPGASTPLPPQINFIHEDAQGTLWFAAETGLMRFDPKTEAFTTYTTADGLPDNVVQCILPDQTGNLWLSTNSGISRFNPRDHSFTNYHERDGLQGEQFNRKACFMDAAGVMYFGGLHGFNMFDPRRIPLRPRDADRVVLTELEIGGRTVTVHPGSVLPKPLWETNRLRFSPKDQEFSLEFASLDYGDQTRVQYRFILEGLEHEWTRVDSRHRSARYTGLRPGAYRFRAQASADGRTWSRREASISIVVAPPWWRTPWSLGAAIAIFAGLLFGAHKLRVRALHERELRLRGLVDQRTAELVEARNLAEQARNEAEHANRAKSVFLANISHDLRTPLNAILGFSTLLRERSSSAEQRRDLQIINRSGQHLLALIDDVLDIARIEAGRTVLKTSPCDVRILVRDVADMMRVRAAEKNLALVLADSGGAPAQARADASKLREILINLVGNAINYTEHGSVTLRFDARRADRDDRMLLRFEVEDTGIGIAPHDQERIFRPFERAVNGRSQKGTGLGLAITRQLVELMGGSIEVESAPGKGSCFRVGISVDRAEDFRETVSPERDRIPSLEASEPEWRILIVDDEPENRALLERFLRDAGFQVRDAASGGQAVETYREWRPHFIWMDVRMPQMDGIEATRRIRILEGGQAVKIVALTASVSESQRGEVFAAGLDDFVRKPYAPDEIFECMARHLGLRYRSMAPTADSGNEPTRRLSADAMAALPETLRSELRNAVVSLDSDRIQEAVDKVMEQDAALGSVLASLAESYTYTPILLATDAVKEESSAASA